MKLRLSYLTPRLDRSLGMGDTFLRFLSDNDGAVAGYRSFFPYFTQGTSEFFVHLTTEKSGGVDVRNSLFSDDFNTFIAHNSSVGFKRYLERFFDQKRFEISKNLAAECTDIFGPTQIIDIEKVLQYLYISGEVSNYYTLFQGKGDVFEDTKAVLLLALEAAFAGDDYTATSECDVSALQNAAQNGLLDVATPFANMGKSFANKMLRETPKHILKGICEMVEPHVIISKIVRETSGKVFEGIETAEKMANSAADMADILANAAAMGAPTGCGETEEGSIAPPPVPRPPMSFEEAMNWIQGRIDMNYPSGMPSSLKPSVSSKGLDLEGTIPLLFFIPPLTPFGIVYLLLNLLEFPYGAKGPVALISDDECDPNPFNQ